MLRFTIRRLPATGDAQGAPWYVFGSQPDWSGDLCWGHFATWDAALYYACHLLRLHSRFAEAY